MSAPIDACEVYKASLNLSPYVGVKSCTPSRISSLKEFVIALVVIAIFILL